MACEILTYLLEHPEAQDTVEGIAEWWLLEQRATRVLAEVEGVVANLVARNLLVAHPCSGGRTYYRLNREKEREIQRHVRQLNSAQDKDGVNPVWRNC